MNPWVEAMMEDPDFSMAYAEEGFFHFNTATSDCPRSPLEAIRAAEELAKKENITKSMAALTIAKEVDLQTSNKTGKWQLFW